MANKTKREEYPKLDGTVLVEAATQMHFLVSGYNKCVSDITQARQDIIDLTGQVRRLSAALEKVLPLIGQAWTDGHKPEFARLTALARDKGVTVAEQPNDTERGKG